jgi:hypothetical protein
MVKSNVRVRRLTLPPLFDAGAKEDTHQQEDEGEEDQIILEKERLSRVTEISLMAREGSRPGLHIHGVESPWGSKLWASGDDDASSVSSGDEDISSPALVSEALEAGLTMEQLRQAEEELSSPSSMSPKVRTHLKEGSIVKKGIDIWVDNRWNMGRPWSGSIMKNVIERRTQAINSTASRDHHHGSSMPQSSFVGPRLSPTMIVNVDRGLPKLDLKADTSWPMQECRGKIDAYMLALANEWRSTSPTAKATWSKLSLEKATFEGNSNSKVQTQGINS